MVGKPQTIFNKNKNWFKKDNSEKLLGKLTKTKERSLKLSQAEMKECSLLPTLQKLNIREYYDYAYLPINMGEMDKFIRRHKLHKFTLQ